MVFIVKYLPRKWMSRWVGILVHLRGPWSQVLIRVFAWYYRINAKEAELALDRYPSLGEFFVRKLKSGARPLSSSWALHPADSRITEFGRIDQGTLVQAKGQTYKLTQFIEDPEAHVKYDQGTFLTYYLCPTDYHRVHSPVAGFIRSATYMPGDLWPVNAWSTKNIPRLFRSNERVYVEIATEFGPVGVVFVGATNVGSIVLPFLPQLVTNQGRRAQRYVLPVPLEVGKGEELGMFRMGSTVVLLLSAEIRKKWPLVPITSGQSVRVGTSLSLD